MSPLHPFPEPDCLHVGPSDKDSFTARMRFHQSWWRNMRNLPPGPNPNARNEVYGNMLSETDGRAGNNFLLPEIARVAEERFPSSNRDRGTRRLYCNLLSSQPMCFNLFGPLKNNLALATRLLRTLSGFPRAATVTDIEFEWAPAKECHLNDRTAFDCLVKYERPDGVSGFVGIETKLTEPFSQKKYDFSERYKWWKSEPDWWWKEGAEGLFPNPTFNQLWRNHLLVFAMLRQKPPQYKEGYCAVVYHEDDKRCGDAMKQYKQHLLPDGQGTLLEWPLGELVAAWEPLLQLEPCAAWLQSFKTRYLDLSKSGKYYSAFLKKKTGIHLPIKDDECGH